ncbi:type II toxin-antitoxin system RelE family toxin [Oscillatoria salina]|uniref:type II toxin-antitoxin system RelE family toxin n=1 Tax=Oscillatoria salina TaxID=331517 RepID=UPI0013BA795A|nr:type II toxin-antitoxin system RelE/ParE family toxin [Oscillatoria salina]MBZ8183291.1 type II toxin-antitoxin system RelE/ParE family toxin [Oscillatoria salina IIICB1]NET87108.1 type II toxin-antitoxin system RelE/ParE family toxin [Kamptonema sp. SIO1D9]
MESDLEYQVIITTQARQLLLQIKDRREQQLLLKKLAKLKHEPDKQGKALTQELSGYRSIRAVGQRYRIVYKIQQAQILVIVVGIGRRKQGDKQDVYALTKQLLAEIAPISSNEEE